MKHVIVRRSTHSIEFTPRCNNCRYFSGDGCHCSSDPRNWNPNPHPINDDFASVCTNWYPSLHDDVVDKIREKINLMAPLDEFEIKEN